MPQFKHDQIIIKNRTETLPYTSNQSGRAKVIPREGLNRLQHGQSIKDQFIEAIEDFQPHEHSDFVYLSFKSPIDFFLDIEKLDKNDCRLATYKEMEVTDEANVIHRYYEAAVFLNKKAISIFLKKIEDYINKTTPINYNEDGTFKSGGNPFNRSLISNIEQIKAATLESFWQEPELPFPNKNEVQWWEIWISKNSSVEQDNPLIPILEFLNEKGVEVGLKYLSFPEHYIYIMKATAEQLADSILYTDQLAEIRKPKETADFFTYLDRDEQNEWIQDLINRTEILNNNNKVSICLLDTGVNITNPLLTPLIPEKNLDTVEPAWSKADIWGHGTPMAGLALYGDLTTAFAIQGNIKINYHLESIKLLEVNYTHDPKLYGAVTQEAIARAEILNPTFRRMVCMAITSSDFEHKGRPSSWSSAIDQSIFGSIVHANDNILFFVSSGNLPLNERANYPIINEDYSIEDPAQSFNAITIGSYTLKDSIDLIQFPNAEILAKHGGMSPCNTTSISWRKDWCKKPDIVMEGGNNGLQLGGTIEPESLQLLSTSIGGLNKPWITTFADTSASTALASKFAAELYTQYPTLLPETIRGLIVHSADWTPEMLKYKNISELSLEEKEHLLSTVGYGIPNFEKSRYSANNSLSLIMERSLKPYQKENSSIKSNEFHLFDLPWPIDTLQELLATPVKFKITLSYFIEPNPGNKQYDLAASYRSHGLRFKMIDRNESLDAFKSRVSKSMREESSQPYEKEGSEHWILGNQIRDKGSIHKDIWEGTAADLATRNKIAVFPVSGWWKNRKKLNRFENSVRYSLILTIETPSEETDILTPVLNQIEIQI